VEVISVITSFGFLPLEESGHLKNFIKNSQEEEIIFLTRLSVIIRFGILPLGDLFKEHI
jgi:hypothetical protein